MQKHNLLSKRSIITVVLIIAVALTGLLLLNSNDALAENNKVLFESTSSTFNKSEISKESTATFSPIVKMVSALFIVIVCIYMSIFLLKKGMGKKFSSNSELNSLELLETTYLGPKKSVSLVRVAGKSVLLGITETQISILTELGEEETAALLSKTQQEVAPSVSIDFKSIFEKVATRFKKTNLNGRHITAESKI